MIEEQTVSLDKPTITIDLAGAEIALEFSLELSGVSADRAHLYHFVCVPCREQNLRKRDEWVSSDVLAESVESEAAVEKMQRALDQCKDHARAHEIIGAWALGLVPDWRKMGEP